MKLLTLFAALTMTAGLAAAAEKTMMHCFAFTPIETASEADWKAFYAATDALPKNIPVIKMVSAASCGRPWRSSPSTPSPQEAGGWGEGRDGEGQPRRSRLRRLLRHGRRRPVAEDLRRQPLSQSLDGRLRRRLRVAGTTAYDVLSS
jgi:hypothetical protein